MGLTPPKGDKEGQGTVLDNSKVFTKTSQEDEMADCIRNSCIFKLVGKWLPDLSKRQWQLLAIFAVADFLAGIVYNIKGPFYPAEAEKKGVTSTQYGFVFGIFDATKVFICPIFGRHMSSIGPKRVFITCMILIAVCSVCFGLLDKIDSLAPFLTLSLIIRVLEAVGSAGFSTSTFSIIACEFPGTVATTFASLETFFGMGLIVGPLLGGIFFQIGGYDAPFIVTGMLLFFAALVILSVMPSISESGYESIPSNVPTTSGSQSTKLKPDEPCSIFRLMKISGVVLALFGVFTAASSTGFVNATLEPHIRQFNLSPVEVGIVFVIYGTVYATTAPFWGWLCDRVTQPKLITLAGTVMNLFAFLLIGPAPFFPYESALWLTCLGLVIHGLALGATFVSGFVLSLRYSIANGLPNNMTTYGVVTGMWTSSLSLGMFVGPAVGGILLDNVGFRWGSMYVFVSMLIVIVLIIMFLIQNGLHIRHTNAEVPEAQQPLLHTKLDSKLILPNSLSESQSAKVSYGTA